MGKACIVCGRDIPKVTKTWYFREPREGRGPYSSGAINFAGQAARPEGHIERGRVLNEIYTAHVPTTRAECARYTNDRIVASRNLGARNAWFSTWDGETYRDDHFCTDRCAMRQGYASADHGDRFTWKSS